MAKFKVGDVVRWKVDREKEPITITGISEREGVYLTSNHSSFEISSEHAYELILSKEDNVNHPKHYTSHPSGIECIEITRHYCFSIGNAIKYLWRAGLKKEEGLGDIEKEIEDLNKSIWYIKDRIKELENRL